METTVGYSQESAQGDRTAGLRLYGRCEIALSGPGTFVDTAVRYFWPQAHLVSVNTSLPLVRLVPDRIPPSLTTDAACRPITLYSSTDGRVPDYNEGLEYREVPGFDRLVVNPHTGSRILVSGSKIHVVNTDTEAGARDALRVVKQLVTTEFEAAGVVTIHASAFAIADEAVAVAGPPGAGKTSTVLAAIEAGARMIANDKVYAATDSHGTCIRGWTDPIRVIEAPGAPKRTVTLAAYFTEDRSRLAVDPLPLRTVVVVDVGTGSVPVRCEELDPPAGLLSLHREVLPPRVRWLGTEPPAAQRPPLPFADRFLRLTYGYRDAAHAMELLLRRLAA